MELAELVNAIKVVELTAKTRSAAIRSLVQAMDWEREGVEPDEVIEAIEEREATAQTVIDTGFALPHAVIDWDGDYRVVLGRSRTGVDYRTGDLVRLIVLLVEGKGRERAHIDLLATVAELLKGDDFRQQIVEARDGRAIERLLRAKAGITPEAAPRKPPTVPQSSSLLLRQAIQLVQSLSAQALLLTADGLENVPWGVMGNWSGRLLIVSTETSDSFPLDRPDTHVFEVEHARLSRIDRANLGLLVAASRGLLEERSSVICVTGPPGGPLDSISITEPKLHLRAIFPVKAKRGAESPRPAVILRVLSLAIELAEEGREARPVGALFVIGDSRQVMQHAQQLVLNPFRGYSRRLRSVLDPSLAETIKEFATIDGAFVVQGDGTVLSAGTYLVPRALPTGLPPGLGSRHQTAAAISAQTQALAITVSQSTGTVTVFHSGAIQFTLERAAATRW